MSVARWIGTSVAAAVILGGFTIAWSRGNEPEQFATRALAFSNSGATVYASGVTGSDEKHSGFLGAWDVTSGKLRWRVETPESGSYVSVAPNDKRLVYVDWNGENTVYARVYDAQTGTLCWQQKLVRNSPSPLYTIRPPVFSTDNRRVLLVYTDGIQVLDGLTGGKSAFWSSDGKSETSIGRVIASSSNKTLLVETHADVYGGHNEPGDVVQLWDAHDGHLIRTLARGADTYSDFAADGKTIAFVSGKGQLRIKDAASDRNVKSAFIPALKTRFTNAWFIQPDTLEVSGWKRSGGNETYHTWTWNTRTGAIRDTNAWYPGRFAEPSPNGNAVAATPDTQQWATVPASLHDRQSGRQILDLQNSLSR